MPDDFPGVNKAQCTVTSLKKCMNIQQLVLSALSHRMTDAFILR
jgi:hypothetical protein